MKLHSRMTDALDAPVGESGGVAGIYELDAALSLRDGITYESLRAAARGLGTLLASAAPPWSRCLLATESRIGFAIGLFACLYAGIVAVPAPGGSSTRKRARLRDIGRSSRASIVVRDAVGRGSEATDAGADEWLLPIVCETERLVVHRIEDERRIGADDGLRAFLSSVDAALVQYSSGSTGSRKGVIVSHGNIADNCRRIIDAFGLRPADRGLLWLPDDHDMGLVGGYFVPLVARFPIYFMRPVDFARDPLSWLEAIARYEITCSGGPDFAYRTCAARYRPDAMQGVDLSSWTIAFNGADTIHAETLRGFAETYRPYGFRYGSFLPCYGLAESTSLVLSSRRGSGPVVRTFSRAVVEGRNSRGTSMRAAQGDVTLVASGRLPAPSRDVRIVDIDRGTECAAREVGEIAIAGSSVCCGYLGPDEECPVVEARHVLLDGEAYLPTGDVGFRDESGNCFVLGRTLERISWNGVTYFASDLERSIERHIGESMPGISAAAITGERQGIRLYLEADRRTSSRLRKAASLSETVPLRPEIERLARAVAAAERALELPICSVSILACLKLPRTDSGKVQRHELPGLAREHILLHFERAELLRRVSRAVSPRCSEEAEICSIVASVLGVENVGVTDDLLALGCDSMHMLRILHRITEVFGVDLRLEDVAAEPSVARMAVKVAWLQSRRNDVRPPALEPAEADGSLLRLVTADEASG